MQWLKSTRFHVGVDLGQQSDFSAMAIVQYDVGQPHFYCRHVERFALHTSYPQIVELVASRLRPIAEYLPYLVVDATGPGLAVVDLMKSRGLRLTPAVITAGFESSTGESGLLHIPKAQLVGGLAVALQTGRLLISRGMGSAETLRSELLEFQVRTGRAGNMRYEARRAAVHDDLAIALMLAVWSANKREMRQEIKGLFRYLDEQGAF